MGNVIAGILMCAVIWWFWRRRKKSIPAPTVQVPIDPSIRTKAEEVMRKQGFIGGSALNAPRGLEAAYLRIMAGVQADNETKKNLYSAIANNNCVATYENFLLPGQWEWPEFDEWKTIFLKDGDFPYMWKKYPEIFLPDFEELRLGKILDQVLIKDIKIIFKTLNIDTPIRVKKTELIELAEHKITTKMLHEACPDIYGDIKIKFEKSINHGKCAILEHTISMLGYHLRDFYSNNQLKLDIIKGCPVEAKYAKGKGNITEYNIPPFFPGDRTGVRLAA